MIYKNNSPVKAYKGDYKPINIYRGDTKVAGWDWSEKSGEIIEFPNTYNDAVTVLQIVGKSVQNGTPTQASPISVLSAGGDIQTKNQAGVALSTATMPILRSIGGISDTFINGQLTQRIGVKTLTATDGWYLSNEGQINERLYFSFPLAALSGVALCTHFKFYSGDDLWDSTAIGFTIDGASNVRFYTSGYSTASSFKTWLTAQNTAGTPVILYYQLATPVVSQTTLTELKTAPNYTTIEQLNATKAVITASAKVSA